MSNINWGGELDNREREREREKEKERQRHRMRIKLASQHIKKMHQKQKKVTHDRARSIIIPDKISLSIVFAVMSVLFTCSNDSHANMATLTHYTISPTKVRSKKIQDGIKTGMIMMDKNCTPHREDEIRKHRSLHPNSNDFNFIRPGREQDGD